MKKNKVYLIVSICLILLSVILIVTAILIKTTTNSENNQNGTNNNDTDKEPNINLTTYICKKQLDQEKSNYEIYQVETLTVQNSRVLSSTSNIIIYCKDEKTYNDFKDDKDYSKDKNFNDQEKSITFSSNSNKDLTKDIDGKELNLNYTTYQEELNQVGYICTEK